MESNNTVSDVIIIGGSYAGLSAGMTLGRSLRNVLIIDSGKPCNWQTPHSHNFITQDGETPATIASRAKEQVLRYPTVVFRNDKVAHARKEADFFEIATEKEEKYRAKKLLLATGVTDIMPAIPGFAACWGISLLHCPYCHGYEVHSQKIGILANGDMGLEMVKLISNWSKDILLFTNGPSTLTSEQTQLIRTKNIPIVEKSILEIQHTKGYIQQVLFEDGTTHSLNAMFVKIPFQQHSDIAQQLGCEFTEMGHIKADEFGSTTIPGVFAAGDNTTFFRAVSVAVSAGNKAAAWINKELITESF